VSTCNNLEALLGRGLKENTGTTLCCFVLFRRPFGSNDVELVERFGLIGETPGKLGPPNEEYQACRMPEGHTS
jgi:hypothetical protein